MHIDEHATCNYTSHGTYGDGFNTQEVNLRAALGCHNKNTDSHSERQIEGCLRMLYNHKAWLEQIQTRLHI